MELKKVCNSCSKTNEQVAGFFATPSAALCGECIMRAAKLLICGQPNVIPEGGDLPHQATCIFCTRTVDQVSKMAVFRDSYVCSECILVMVDGLIKEENQRMKFIPVPPTG